MRFGSTIARTAIPGQTLGGRMSESDSGGADACKENRASPAEERTDERDREGNQGEDGEWSVVLGAAQHGQPGRGRAGGHVLEVLHEDEEADRPGSHRGPETEHGPQEGNCALIRTWRATPLELPGAPSEASKFATGCEGQSACEQQDRDHGDRPRGAVAAAAQRVTVGVSPGVEEHELVAQHEGHEAQRGQDGPAPRAVHNGRESTRRVCTSGHPGMIASSTIYDA